MGFGLTQPLTSNSLLSPGTKPGVTLASSPGQTAPGKQMTVLQKLLNSLLGSNPLCEALKWILPARIVTTK